MLGTAGDVAELLSRLGFGHTVLQSTAGACTSIASQVKATCDASTSTTPAESLAPSTPRVPSQGRGAERFDISDEYEALAGWIPPFPELESEPANEEEEEEEEEEYDAEECSLELNALDGAAVRLGGELVAFVRPYLKSGPAALAGRAAATVGGRGGPGDGEPRRH